MKYLKSIVGFIAGTTLTSTISLIPDISHAIVIGPGNYIFVNPDNTRTATDFSVQVLNPPPFIDVTGSNGGPEFPGPVGQSIDGGGVSVITYNVLQPGVGGVLPNQLYAHSFPGWPEGTLFNVLFSYDDFPYLLDPQIRASFSFSPSDIESFRALVSSEIHNREVGVTISTVPEPTSTIGLLTLGTLGAVATFNRKRNLFKST